MICVLAPMRPSLIFFRRPSRMRGSMACQSPPLRREMHHHGYPPSRAPSEHREHWRSNFSSLRASRARPGGQRLPIDEYSTAFRLCASLGRNDEVEKIRFHREPSSRNFAPQSVRDPWRGEIREATPWVPGLPSVARNDEKGCQKNSISSSLRASAARPGGQRLPAGEYSTTFRLCATLGRNDEVERNSRQTEPSFRNFAPQNVRDPWRGEIREAAPWVPGLPSVARNDVKGYQQNSTSSSLRASRARPGGQRLPAGEYSTAFRLCAALGRNDEGGRMNS